MSRIDPGGIPGAKIDLGAVRSGASGVTSSGGTIRDQGAQVVRDWQALPASFEATGTEALYAAMTPVGTTTTAIGDALGGIGRALSSYADEVEPIKARLDALRGQAAAFVARTNAFTSHVEWISSGYTLGVPMPEKVDSWDEDPGLNDENNALIRQVAAAEADWLDAQQRCASAIRAAVGLAAVGAGDERALAAGLRSGEQLQTEWGGTSDRKESCSEKAVTFQTHFVWDGVIVGFGWDTLKGIGALVGIDPTGRAESEVWNGLWSGDWQLWLKGQQDSLAAFGSAWLGVAHIASSIAIPIDPATRMSLLNGGALDWLPDDLTQGAKDWTAADGTALYGTVAGLVGLTLPTTWWDPKAFKADQVFRNWTENPGGAAGTSVANIGSFLIPGVGELKAAGVAGDAAKVAEGTRVADMIADGSIETLRGLSGDALKATIKGLSDADAAKLAAELAKPELDVGALSGLKLDDLTIHEPPADPLPAAPHPERAHDHTSVGATAPAHDTAAGRGTSSVGDTARVHDTAAVHEPASAAQGSESSHGHSPATEQGAEPGLHDGPTDAPSTQAKVLDTGRGGDGTEAHDAPSADPHPGDEGAGAVDHKYSVAIFGPSNKPFYEVPDPTLGRSGRPFFVMPAEDAAAIHDSGSAARYTGMSPSTLEAYKAGDDVYAVVFPTEGIPHAVPTAADAMGWEHYLEGGHTAVLLEGPKAGYLVNPTHEFVIPGGTRLPPGSVLVRIGDRAWEVLHRW